MYCRARIPTNNVFPNPLPLLRWVSLRIALLPFEGAQTSPSVTGPGFSGPGRQALSPLFLLTLALLIARSNIQGKSPIFFPQARVFPFLCDFCPSVVWYLLRFAKPSFPLGAGRPLLKSHSLSLLFLLADSVARFFPPPYSSRLKDIFD